MLNSSLCDYSDAYILVKVTITDIRVWENPAVIKAHRNNQQILKNWAPWTNCISQTNNTQADRG